MIHETRLRASVSVVAPNFLRSDGKFLDDALWKAMVLGLLWLDGQGPWHGEDSAETSEHRSTGNGLCGRSQRRLPMLRRFYRPCSSDQKWWQHTIGVGMPEELQSRITAPETYTLNAAQLTLEGSAEVQLSLSYDVNLQLYPRRQEYLRSSGVSLLALWGGQMTFSSPKVLKHSLVTWCWILSTSAQDSC